MGLFDDLMGIVNEGNALRDEIKQLGSDVAKELVSDATSIKQTISDTGSAAQSLAQDLGLQTPSQTIPPDSAQIQTPSDQQQNT